MSLPICSIIFTTIIALLVLLSFFFYQYPTYPTISITDYNILYYDQYSVSYTPINSYITLHSTNTTKYCNLSFKYFNNTDFISTNNYTYNCNNTLPICIFKTKIIKLIKNFCYNIKSI